MILRHAVIRWGDPLLLGVGFVDHDHCEAVEMINRMAAAAPSGRLDLARTFALHCVEHFAREEEMMVKTGFFALEPHRDEHRRVVAELDEVIRALEDGEPRDEYFTVDHHYPEKSVRLHFFNCLISQGEPRAIEVADLRWVDPADLDHFEFPAADVELIALLRSRSQ